jgi:hypothetical protein
VLSCNLHMKDCKKIFVDANFFRNLVEITCLPIHDVRFWPSSTVERRTTPDPKQWDGLLLT